MPFFTGDDWRAAFNLFCCVYGIGTLGMPKNYVMAGPIAATVGLFFLATANVYASVSVSKALLRAPAYVRTYGDLGEWAAGKIGRYAVVVSQTAVCLLIPLAFLILGGIIFSVLFPAAGADANPLWICIMALTLLPVVLAPTLKETAMVALVGCLGTLVADFIALGVLLHHFAPLETTPPQPSPSFDSIARTFGNLSLAYGAAIVIPALQRHHPQPQRLPRVIFMTLTVISVLFLFIAVTGYVLVGCQLSGNLLFTIAGSALGFTTDAKALILSFLAMQVHITIAFAVILHPALYVMERAFLGLHKEGDIALEGGVGNVQASPEGFASIKTNDSTVEDVKRTSHTSVADINLHEEEISDPYDSTPMGIAKRVIFRIAIVAVLVTVACLFKNYKDGFLALVDFVGASAISACCIVIPCILRLKIFWKELPMWEKAFNLFVIVLCSVLGVYTTIKEGENMVNAFRQEADPNAVKFPYCSEKYNNVIYTNETHYGEL